MNFQSEIELPELPIVEFQIPDVTIQLGEVPDQLDKPLGIGILYETALDDFLFKIESIAKYRVQNGMSITIQQNIGALAQEVRLFLYGSAFGALIHQKGMLPLHGSSIVNERGAYIFIGHSAAGKSTLAASMAMNGHSVIADDISVICNTKKRGVVMYPGIPYLKLWKDVVIGLGIKQPLEKIRPNLEKYRLPLQKAHDIVSYPIQKVVLLDHHNKNEFHSTRINGVDKFNILKTHTYRFNYVEGLCKTIVQFQNISELAQQTELYRINRPISPLLIKELRLFIENEILT